jgi:hypothetical protein
VLVNALNEGKGAKRILDLLHHEQILDEINWRDALAFEEDFDKIDDDDEEGVMSTMPEDCKSEGDSSKSE